MFERKICTKCGNSAKMDALFCSNCGGSDFEVQNLVKDFIPHKKTCRKCGKQVKDDVSFCPNCGCSSFEPVNAAESGYPESNGSFCRNCGQQIDQNAAFCKNCGQPIRDVRYKAAGKRKEICCLPSFILGIIGSTFGLLGGICTTMCSVFNSNSAFF